MLHSTTEWKREEVMPKLFIGNIPNASSELEIQKWVESHGFRVESVEVIYDRATGKPRGFGFVSLSDEADIQRAITALNGRRMEGRVLTVNKATPLSPRSEYFGPDGKPRLL
jgi:cold-inducible RNA-binding protein